MKQKERTSTETSNNKGKFDEILQMFEEQKNKGMIESIVIKEKIYYFFMCSPRQIEDIVQLCCRETESSVLGIDTTFNLCNLWVTDSCYKNDRIVHNVTGNHPVFLGPLLFHFTKDESTFTRFALEMIALDPEVINIKKIGSDMEKAIYNGVKAIIPSAGQLYCVQHLSQCDEKKLDKLLDKQKFTSSQRCSSKSSILKDIYGERKGSVYEYGLAEAQDFDDFNAKLVSLKEKWESLCPGFYAWFLKKRKEKFEKSVIASAREGTNVSGLFYQNDIESIHHIEKLSQCFKKQSIVDVTRNLRDLALRQENDEIRAIYGAGNYSLSTEYSNFKVDSARWHGWDESRRRDHVDKFRKHKPTPSNYFQKPKNVGRKPSFQQRDRAQKPDVIIDRIENQSQSLASCDDSPSCSTSTTDNVNNYLDSVRFMDPRKEPETQFELHFRKDLPRLVTKCQGQCGVAIKPDEEGMLVRSYGTSSWTDRKTGASKSKYGKLYIHFNQKCLEAFDSKNFYGPGHQFDFKRIKVDKTTQEKLKDAERGLLNKLGVTFL